MSVKIEFTTSSFEDRMKEQEMMSRYGWYAHYVFPENQSIWANYHTHGLVESFGHLDFQIVANIAPKVAHSIMRSLVEKVKNGDSFADGDIVEGVIRNSLLVKLVERAEGGRNVLRVIFPDSKGELDPEFMEGYLAGQEFATIV